MATGGLRYWKDGREVPDILLGMFDYPQTEKHPAFNLSLRVNFVDGTGDNTYLRLVGNEGSMIVEWDKVTLTKNKYWPTENYAQYFSAHQYEKDYDRKKMEAPEATVFKAEDGYKGAHYDHLYNWIARHSRWQGGGRKSTLRLSRCCSCPIVQRQLFRRKNPFNGIRSI